MDISLDEFIRLKKTEGRNTNTINSQNNKTTSEQSNNKCRTSLSKFDRINASNDSDSDEDEIPNQKMSVEFSKKIQELDYSKCGAYKSNNNKTKSMIKSHQYRLENKQQKCKNQNNNKSSCILNGHVSKRYRNPSGIHELANDFTFRRPNNLHGIAPEVVYNARRGSVTRNIRHLNMNLRQQIDNHTPGIFESIATGDEQIIVRKVIRPVGARQNIQVNFDITDLLRYQSPIVPPIPQSANYNRLVRNQGSDRPSNSNSTILQDSPLISSPQDFPTTRNAAPVLVTEKFNFTKDTPRSLLPGQKPAVLKAGIRNEVKDLMTILKTKNEVKPPLIPDHSTERFSYNSLRIANTSSFTKEINELNGLVNNDVTDDSPMSDDDTDRLLLDIDSAIDDVGYI